MIGSAFLRNGVDGWKFSSEVALENFIWENLSKLFGVQPLKRQHISNGERCDILASNGKELVIIELKNVEDRYLIQQLTRYYSNLLEENPFPLELDYSKPIRLISVAPSYHRHNLIDRYHSRLEFEFFEFKIDLCDGNHLFQLKRHEETEFTISIPIPYQELDISSSNHILDLPEILIRWLGGSTKDERKIILSLRNKLLSSSPRMKEIVEKRSIKYGSGKTRICAEICFHISSQKPIVFLWLPTPSTYIFHRDARKAKFGRLRIWNDSSQITHLGHIPDGFGQMRTKSEWEQVPNEKCPKYMRNSISGKSHTPIEVEGYMGLHGVSEKPDFWEVLSDMAVKRWLER